MKAFYLTTSTSNIHPQLTMPDEVVNKCFECFKTAANKDLLHLILRLVVITTKDSTVLDQVKNWAPGSFVTSYASFFTSTTIVTVMTLYCTPRVALVTTGKELLLPLLLVMAGETFILAENLHHSNNIPAACQEDCKDYLHLGIEDSSLLLRDRPPVPTQVLLVNLGPVPAVAHFVPAKGEINSR